MVRYYVVQGLVNISAKDKRVNILGFAGHMVFIRTIQLGGCSSKLAIGGKSEIQYSSVSIKLSFLRLLKFEFSYNFYHRNVLLIFSQLFKSVKPFSVCGLYIKTVCRLDLACRFADLIVN